MSILGSLMGKILGHGASTPGTKASAAPAAPASAPATPGATAAPPVVDVETVLETMAAGRKGLDWRNSIVDLMTLVGMDSSLANRRELAQELGYTGDMKDTAPMNIWLHKQVLRKLSENGGHVPADLLD